MFDSGQVRPPSVDLYIHISQPVPTLDDGETRTIPYALPSSSKVSHMSLVVNLQASLNGPSPAQADGVVSGGGEHRVVAGQVGTGRWPASLQVWPPSKELYMPIRNR